MTDAKKQPIFESVTGRKRLLKTYEKCRLDCFDDLLYCCAVTVEDAMLLGGGIPNVSYTFTELFKMALPMAMERSKDQGGTTITVGVPDSHPGAGLVPQEPTLGDTLEQELYNYIRLRTEKGRNNGATRSGISFSLPFRGRREQAREALQRLIDKGLVRKDEDASPPRYWTTGTL